MHTRSRVPMMNASNDAQHNPASSMAALILGATGFTKIEMKEDSSEQERKTIAVDSSADASTPPQRDRIELQVLPDFLSATECEHLISLATTPHPTEDDLASDFPRLVPFAPFYSSARTSSHIVLATTSTCGMHLRDPVVAAVIDRAAAIAAVPSNRLWDMKLIRYEAGQFFAPHLDNGPDPRLNPSVRSFFVFLNTLPEGSGGETHFTKLDRKFAPVRGQALTWLNCSKDGRVYFAEAEHQGCAPKEGVKYGLNFFFNLTTP